MLDWFTLPFMGRRPSSMAGHMPQVWFAHIRQNLSRFRFGAFRNASFSGFSRNWSPSYQYQSNMNPVMPLSAARSICFAIQTGSDSSK